MRPIHCSLINHTLLIGCTGFIGTSILDYLLQSSPISNVPYYFNLSASPKEIFALCERTCIKTVFYLCGHSNVSSSNKTTLDADVDVAIYVRKILSHLPSIRVIFVASSALLTWRSHYLDHKAPKNNSLHFYIQAKMAVENIFNHHFKYDPTIACVRLSNVFGLNDRNNHRIIPYIRDCIQLRKPIVLNSSPNSEINLIYDRALCRQFIEFMDTDDISILSSPYSVFLSVCYQSLTLEQLLDIISKHVGVSPISVTYGHRLDTCPVPLNEASPFMISFGDSLRGIHEVFCPLNELI